MKATMAGYRDYMGAAPEPEMTEASLRAVEQKVRALILPRVPKTEMEASAVEYATYEQAREQTWVGDRLVQNRLRSFKLGELAMTLASAGLSREEALFPGGLCPQARALLAGAGLMYRGVG